MNIPRPILHRLRNVEQHVHLTIRLATVTLKIRAFGPSKYVPVDMPQVIAGSVGAIFGELLREAKIRRPVQAGNKPVDHSLSNEVEAGNPREDRRIEKSL